MKDEKMGEDNSTIRDWRKGFSLSIEVKIDLASNLDFCLQNLASDLEQIAKRVKFFSDRVSLLRQLYEESKKHENASSGKQPDGV